MNYTRGWNGVRVKLHDGRNIVFNGKADEQHGYVGHIIAIKDKRKWGNHVTSYCGDITVVEMDLIDGAYDPMKVTCEKCLKRIEESLELKSHNEKLRREKYYLNIRN